jgi:aspartate-semialdehyde dehydrogenase
MDPTKKLVVPEVNADVLTADDKIIANPNCSTIQMVVALKPLHDKYKIKRVVVSTYQSVTGTGVKAVDQLFNERKGIDGPKVYPYTIDLNVIPQIDVFTENGYTKEEMKMILETKKIMGDDSIKVTATTVRIPVMGGHSESVNIEFLHDFDLAKYASF